MSSSCTDSILALKPSTIDLSVLIWGIFRLQSPFLTLSTWNLSRFISFSILLTSIPWSWAGTSYSRLWCCYDTHLGVHYGCYLAASSLKLFRECSLFMSGGGVALSWKFLYKTLSEGNHLITEITIIFLARYARHINRCTFTANN